MATNIAPPPPPKKSNVLLWTLVGCGGLLLLIGMVVVGGIAYIAHDPAKFMTKMITAADPNVEVVSVNNSSQKITLRNKQTGQVYTISFNDAKNGRLNMGGRATLPAWVPDYPGSNPRSAFSTQGSEGERGLFTFKTSDQPDKITRFYQDQFSELGFKVASGWQRQQGGAWALSAEDAARHRTVTVTVVEPSGTDTATVSVTYAANK